MNFAVVFPGQGSQRIGMGASLCAGSAAARRCFEEASDALGYDMLELCTKGPEERLRLTEYTQPAILTVSMAAYGAWHERFGLKPVAAAGHSLGEYSALVAAGVIVFTDAVRIVRLRGQAMQEAVPVGVGAMAAVLNLDGSALAAICAAESRGVEVVAPANFNAPGQVVISGHAAAVARVGDIAKQHGAKRVLPLEVSAPFHCSLMQPAALRLGAALAGIRFGEARFRVFANVSAAPYPAPWGNGDAARQLLVEQVCAPVRWEEGVRRMIGDGVDQVVECGPGKVLTALVKRILSDDARSSSVTLSNVESMDDLTGAPADAANHTAVRG